VLCTAPFFVFGVIDILRGEEYCGPKLRVGGRDDNVNFGYMTTEIGSVKIYLPNH